MHGHGANEYFRLHPQLRKERVVSTQSQPKEGTTFENDSLPPAEIGGNVANLGDASLPMISDPPFTHTSPDPTSVVAPPV
ncbi:hypothetical protein IEQ34_010133 [Dendrobium chrysotoxum]|uniref:Uncharacterized protein n=1 Tax=Dendrobium chrysotoxum TaxID=161865 RepID=A0AAV7H4F6_DENCH|nr:hypothetical protein IEQ34_010133 [Dendrobium chrysotoxum]